MPNKTNTTAQSGSPTGEIVLYSAPDGTVELDVRIEQETIWLTQKQMSELFDTERSVITKHLRNIFNTFELLKNSVSANFAHTAADGKTYRTDFYNLDAIISVGYRVNSKRGTQFRIWATRVLKDHILKGYTVNERRLRDLNQAIRLIAGVVDRPDLTGDEAKALLRVVGEYSFALDLLDDYDYQRVSVPPAGVKMVHPLTYTEALRIIEQLRERFGGSSLFGRQNNGGLKAALGAVMQTFDERDLYPSLEEKAAHLLYFLIKNHPFVDGNKRIGAALFLWFLERNAGLRDRKGERRISDAALVALTLLMAESKPEEKEIIVRIVTHLLCEREGENPT
ncbi:MAG: cytochrome C biogenesis protein CycH [Desulfobacteraceae bacterium]|nr:MAG: cytochrome C biogenesis protein CycH [Desulfobacteraceae bacterium]